MRTARTYTAHFDIETRQHELLGLDLGEGMPRRALILGFTLLLTWTGSLLALFGLPSRVSFTLYVLPPLLVAAVGTRRSRRSERRWNITYWTLAARYQAVGHRPLLCGGRRAASRAEWIPSHDRWGAKADVLRRESVRRHRDQTEDRRLPVAAGAPIALAARPRLYGPDAVARARGLGKDRRGSRESATDSVCKGARGGEVQR